MNETVTNTSGFVQTNDATPTLKSLGMKIGHALGGCPSCGYCPSCGRGGYVPKLPTWQQPWPWPWMITYSL